MDFIEFFFGVETIQWKMTLVFLAQLPSIPLIVFLLIVWIIAFKSHCFQLKSYYAPMYGKMCVWWHSMKLMFPQFSCRLKPISSGNRPLKSWTYSSMFYVKLLFISQLKNKLDISSLRLTNVPLTNRILTQYFHILKRSLPLLQCVKHILKNQQTCISQMNHLVVLHLTWSLSMFIFICMMSTCQCLHWTNHPRVNCNNGSTEENQV